MCGTINVLPTMVLCQVLEIECSFIVLHFTAKFSVGYFSPVERINSKTGHVRLICSIYFVHHCAELSDHKMQKNS